MVSLYVLTAVFIVFVALFALALGRSMTILQLRREENRRRELEMGIMEKRSEILREGKRIAHDLEEVLYKARVQQEIDDIIR